MKIIQRIDTGCEHKKEIQSEKWLLEKYISLQESHPHPHPPPTPIPAPALQCYNQIVQC